MSQTRQRYYFHAGKGGVGKSTSSSLTALHLARTGRKVVLVSLDPAHNQGDIFATDLDDKPRKLAPGLEVAQADMDVWMGTYLKGIEKQMKRTYSYQTAFNLEKHMGIIRHSPGIEEYALLLAFKHYREANPDADVIIYDMPPTALTMKFFHLPALSLLWLSELQKLRQEILERKEIITRIHVGKKEIEVDKITCKLNEQQTLFGDLSDVFRDPDLCGIHIVVNPDTLSFAEAQRVEDQLREMGIALRGVIMNKVAEDSVWDEDGQLFRNNTVHPLPLSSAPLIGLDALSDYLDAHPDIFSFAE